MNLKDCPERDNPQTDFRGASRIRVLCTRRSGHQGLGSSWAGRRSISKTIWTAFKNLRICDGQAILPVGQSQELIYALDQGSICSRYFFFFFF